jgi:signal transduction histidine kinase
VQVIAFLPEEPSVMAAEGIRLTDTYLQLPMVQLSRSRSRAAASIAIPAPMVSLYQSGSTAHAGTLQEYTYPTEAQCLSAMNTDEVDSIFCSSVYASYVVSRSRPGRYTVTALTGYTSNMTMGILQDGDQMLYSILNRCIQYTDSSTVNELITQYSQTYDNSLAGIVNRLPAGVILVTAVIMAAMVTGLIAALVLLYQRTRREKALAEEKEKVEADAKANAIRSSFFGAISHDMRTPLNAITGFIRLARKNGITPKQREDYLDKAESSSRLLLDLIDDTLTVSKAESGKLELRPQPMSLQALGVSLLTPIRELAAQKHVEIISDSSAVRSRMVIGDQLQLQKIYLNLMNNAVKYTPSGGHVWITARDEPAGGEDPDFVVEIRDDGIGMSEEYLPHLFEPFSQERRPGYESVGTGLGLSIVHQLVDLMHGTITVVSRKDEGTCFTVRVHLPEVKDIPVVPQPAMDAGAETHVLSGKKVLVCEDNVLNREIAVELLKERGMTAAEAENGQIGVSMFQASGPDEFFAVLMDIRMPVMDGYEATGAIRALDRPDARTVPIIAMTADAYEEDVRRCMKAGMNAHIAKPVDPEVLFRTLIRCQPSHHQS